LGLVGGIALEIGFDLPVFCVFDFFSVSLRNLELSIARVFLLLHFIFSTVLSYTYGGPAGWRFGGLFEF
jgi:hypothetical protein